MSRPSACAAGSTCALPDGVRISPRDQRASPPRAALVAAAICPRHDHDRRRARRSTCQALPRMCSTRSRAVGRVVRAPAAGRRGRQPSLAPRRRSASTAPSPPARLLGSWHCRLGAASTCSSVPIQLPPRSSLVGVRVSGLSGAGARVVGWLPASAGGPTHGVRSSPGKGRPRPERTASSPSRSSHPGCA
jgi:hypothetical protein